MSKRKKSLTEMRETVVAQVKKEADTKIQMCGARDTETPKTPTQGRVVGGDFEPLFV